MSGANSLNVARPFLLQNKTRLVNGHYKPKGTPTKCRRHPISSPLKQEVFLKEKEGVCRRLDFSPKTVQMIPSLDLPFMSSSEMVGSGSVFESPSRFSSQFTSLIDYKKLPEPKPPRFKSGGEPTKRIKSPTLKKVVGSPLPRWVVTPKPAQVMTKEEREGAFIIKLMAPLVLRTEMIYRERLRQTKRQETNQEPLVKMRRKAPLDTWLNNGRQALKTKKL